MQDSGDDGASAVDTVRHGIGRARGDMPHAPPLGGFAILALPTPHRQEPIHDLLKQPVSPYLQSSTESKLLLSELAPGRLMRVYLCTVEVEGAAAHVEILEKDVSLIVETKVAVGLVCGSVWNQACPKCRLFAFKSYW